MLTHTWLKDVEPEALSPSQVHRQISQLLRAGCPLLPAGQAKADPEVLTRGFMPKNKVVLFGHNYFLSNVRHDNQFRFFVAYVQLADATKPDHKRPLHPRIFYKDSSLVWRVATHYIKSENEHWIGKGDVKPHIENGKTVWYSAEETTNLPFEIQSALDTISRRVSKPHPDRRALPLVLRNAPDDRVKPYADFSSPRDRAMRDLKQRINNNQLIAWFEDPILPQSLRFADGFAPDFSNGLICGSNSRSRLYGGHIARFRIASHNRQVQYYFYHGPDQSWIIPPQPLDQSIFSYGVRAIDANVDEKLCIPGYEYHFQETEVPESLYSQIPHGFAGKTSEVDPQRADASAWNHSLPIMKNFFTVLPKLIQQTQD